MLVTLTSERTICRVRLAGVQSEMEPAFASLHLLCTPMMDQPERPPAPQRGALEVAFGLRIRPQLARAHPV
jgi:hypothetical protein